MASGSVDGYTSHLMEEAFKHITKMTARYNRERSVIGEPGFSILP